MTPDERQFAEHLMSTLRKLTRLNVTAVSVNRTVRATANAVDGVGVTIEPAALATGDARLLGEQVSAAICGVLRGIRRGNAEILTETSSRVREGSAEHTAPPDDLWLMPAAAQVDEIVTVSDGGNVKMKMDGYDSVTVRIRPDSPERVDSTALVREINETVARTLRDYARCAAESPTTKVLVSDVG